MSGLQAIEKSKVILSEEGLHVFLDRLFRISWVRLKRPFLDNRPIIEKWKGLKDRYRGERAFVIGNGPSLNRTPMHLLKNEYTMCFNRFNIMFERLDWIPQFYSTIDDRVLSDMVNEIGGLIEAIPYVFIPDIHPYNINFRKRIPDADNVYWLFLDKLAFSQNLPYCGINKTVANVGLQVLAYMGFNPIYLIGLDLDYRDHASARKDSKRDWTSTQDDDPNHFDPRYFGSGRRYHHPRMEETIKRFEEGKRFFDGLNVRVLNATLGGKLEVFPRVDFRSLFRESASEEFELFKRAILNKLRDPSDLNREAVHFKDFLTGEAAEPLGIPGAAISPERVLFSLETDEAVRSIARYIHEFVPFGPIDGRTLFVRRSRLKG